ncbi:MAG: TM2 domain-containing protein [Dehalococcoidia bacterium]|nr:TM2 domain-containing protein [Dehalococcoidia bacterium]
MFCSRCGMQLNEGAAFCSRCGAQVVTIADDLSFDVSPKSRLAATLLSCPWLVVGLFGAHRFYVGKIRTAALMLLLGLSPILCGVGMAVVAITSVPDAENPPVLFWVFYGLTFLLGFAAFIWALADFIIAVTGNFRDRQGKLIKRW